MLPNDINIFEQYLVQQNVRFVCKFFFCNNPKSNGKWEVVLFKLTGWPTKMCHPCATVSHASSLVL